MHVFLAPLYTLLHGDVSLHWNKELEAVFFKWNKHWHIIAKWHYQIQKRNFFKIKADASAIGVGTVLVQPDDKRRMQDIANKSRFSPEIEQKDAVIYRLSTDIFLALEIHEFLIVGFEHPITIFSNYKPSLSVFAQKCEIYPQSIIFQRPNCFHTLSKTCFFWTQGRKLCLADLLSRYFSTNLLKNQQNWYETTLQSTEFHTATSEDTTNVNQTHYVIKTN